MRKLNTLIFIYLVLSQFVALASEPFRFAFFTDLHISPSDPQAAINLQNAVEDVNAQKNIDFVIVGGDIVSNGDSVSLVKARDILKTLKIPFYAVPGNHDFCWNEGRSSTLFNRIFGDSKFVFTHKGYVFAGFATVPQLKSENAKVQQADLKWLMQSLDSAGKQKPILLITHYPWLTGDIDNWQELTDSLRQYNVKAVLNGHYHRNTLLNYKNIPGIVNCSTLQARSHPGGYSLYTISDAITVSEKQSGEEEIVWLELPLTIPTPK